MELSDLRDCFGVNSDLEDTFSEAIEAWDGVASAVKDGREGEEPRKPFLFAEACDPDTSP